MEKKKKRSSAEFRVRCSYFTSTIFHFCANLKKADDNRTSEWLDRPLKRHFRHDVIKSRTFCFVCLRLRWTQAERKWEKKDKHSIIILRAVRRLSRAIVLPASAKVNLQNKHVIIEQLVWSACRFNCRKITFRIKPFSRGAFG